VLLEGLQALSFGFGHSKEWTSACCAMGIHNQVHRNERTVCRASSELCRFRLINSTSVERMSCIVCVDGAVRQYHRWLN
jgi:hypothetical protein